MNNWKINKTVDLAVGVNGVDVWPNALLVENDGNAHEINITVMDDGLPAELTGTATAYFVRVDDATVLEPATVNGNVVSVTLPKACYVYEGDLKAVIRITDGESTVTLGAFLFFVRPMTTNFVVDPSEIVPSLEELLQQIQQMENVSKAANEAAESANTAADSANKAAEAAQAVMDDIEAALDEAGQALSDAKQTKELSESALNDANQALENANTATSAANDATNLANEAASGANAAADAANQAATDAESRVSAAVQDAETTVDEAIKNAQQQVDESLSAAQQTLDSAVADANSAVENAVSDANAATQAANTAASGADTAAAGANAQANAAEQAAQTASNAAGSAQTATEAAEDATQKALDAAERANNAASGAGFQKEVLDHLPEPSEMVENVLYLVPASDPNPDNVYEEYMLINGKRELIGSTAVDLTGYAKTDDIDAKLAKKLDATATAAAAVKATQDSAGQSINATYIKNISVNGTKVTVTRGDNSTFELITQDTDTTYKLATNLALGLTKLYDATGNATDGAMTQGATTTELGKKLPSTGGTLTGDLTLSGTPRIIKANAGDGVKNILSVYRGDANGVGVVIEGGGRTIIGGGEAASALRNALGTTVTDEAIELLHLASDQTVCVHSNCQDVASRKTWTFAANGNITPPNGGQFSGNASTASKLSAARKISLSGDVTGEAQFDGSGDVEIGTIMGGIGSTDFQNKLGIQYGSLSFTVAANTTLNQTVVFPKPFVSPPLVIGGMTSGGPTQNYGYIGVVLNRDTITATQCTIVICNRHTSQHIMGCNWVAIGQMGPASSSDPALPGPEIFDDPDEDFDGPYADPGIARADYIAMMAGIEIPADAQTTGGVQADAGGMELPGLDELTHSDKFELVKLYYDAKVWNEQMVKNSVNKWITESEADEIIADKSEQMC